VLLQEQPSNSDGASRAREAKGFKPFATQGC
jgi:hypothetical protein